MNIVSENIAIEVKGPVDEAAREILTPAALQFLAELHSRFNDTRLHLLARRDARQKEIDAGRLPDFLPETLDIRMDPDWRVGPIPDDLQKRWVEITGPIDRKMMINALNSDADVFMADCEDSNAPTWENIIQGQINLRDAVNKTIAFEDAARGKSYQLKHRTALLLVRPRGWHLSEKNLQIENVPLSASLVDFGLYFFHNARQLLNNGSGPYFYLPKLENRLEARLWNDVFNFAQDALDIPRGSIKVTVLIETILGAFEMEEILYELRDHIAGLNAGRWDYIFSVIKTFRNQPGFLLPDRAQISMTVPFMRAYTELMVKVCHKRGAHAIGGMAAFIPSRRDEEVNRVAMEKVRDDKVRETGDGFDGTWIAHPDLAAMVRSIFADVLGAADHQKQQMREDVMIDGKDLMNFNVPDGKITEAGLRLNINVAILYLESWLQGVGAAALYNLMEDAATAEISRAQIWNWIRHPDACLDDGREINLELYDTFVASELEKIEALVGEKRFQSGRFDIAVSLLNDLVKSDDFDNFLTLKAYQHI